MTRRTLSVDAAIVGAGIGGLWIANLLALRGLSFVVCEPRGVGGIQTLASQGIVHGGAKYRSGGTATLAGALEAMPSRWRACLQGAGEVDLRSVGLLAEKLRFHLGNETRELDDFVLDIDSLVRRLAEPISNRILAAEVSPESLVPGPDGIERIELAAHTIHAGVYVFAAGTGNQALAERAGFAPATRHRPLRQTIVRLRRSADVYAHWTPSPSRIEPTLTVTSHGSLLSIGGTVADDGVSRGEPDHLATVKNLLHRAFPAIDVGNAAFESFIAVRAEPEAKAIRDIPDAYMARHGNCLLCLPVKLSLAPRLGDLVMSEIGPLDTGRKVWPGDPDSSPAYAPSPYTDHPC